MRNVQGLLDHPGALETFCAIWVGKHFVSICVENIFGAICVENIFRTVRVHMDGKRFREQTMRRYFVKKEERAGQQEYYTDSIIRTQRKNSAVTVVLK